MEQKVHCQYGHVYPRTVFQEWLGQANPRWRAFITELERTGAQPKINPDGDVRVKPPFLTQLPNSLLFLGHPRRGRFVRRLCRSSLPKLRSKRQNDEHRKYPSINPTLSPQKEIGDEKFV